MFFRRAALASLLALTLQTAAAADAAVDDRIAAYRGFREAFDARRYVEALPLALEVQRLTEAGWGEDAVQLAAPLTNVGTTYHRLGRHGEAIDAYARALAILDEHAGKSDLRLVRPLHGLGAALHALGRDEEAVEPLKRAVEISRNQGGLYDPNQLPLLKLLASAYGTLGHFEEAGREHQYALTVAEASWGKDDLRLLPVLDEVARWNESVGNYAFARDLHARAASLAERVAGRGSVQMVPGLRGLARAFREAWLQGSEDEVAKATSPLPSFDNSVLARSQIAANSEGERALRLAIQIAKSASPADPRLLGEVQTDLGDWYMTLGSLERAHENYREAWKNLASAGAADELARPRLLAWRPPSSSLARRREDAEDLVRTRAIASFTVLPDGETRDVTIAGGDAPEGLARSLVSALKRARFRPAVVDGAPVATPDVRHEEILLAKPPKDRD